jgi:hypothetical protein
MLARSRLNTRKWPWTELALLPRKMVLSLNALGFLVDLSFSGCGSSLARVHPHEEIAGEAEHIFARTNFAVWLDDADAVGHYGSGILASKGKRDYGS